MRTDLGSLSTGRAAAQASHAASAFAKKYGNTEGYKKWAKQTPQGFGTAIVLGVKFNDIAELSVNEDVKMFPQEIITDPDYVISISSEIVPFLNADDGRILIEAIADKSKYLLHRSEITCAYIFGDKDALQPILGHLPLYS